MQANHVENPMVIGEYYEPKQPKVFSNCDKCGEPIYEQEDFYDFHNWFGVFWCESCVEGRKREA